MFPQYIVAERLKRLDSIINKLKRFSNMSLWTIQDLGGCRVIVNEIDEVYSCADKYENSKKRHILKREYDYINHPKSSGYRSLHRVYLFHSDSKNTYNRNMCIEIQYRTHLQHLWATAVETMGLARRESIKTGQGNDDIKRFFILISSLFALRENMPVVPGTSDNIEELVFDFDFCFYFYFYFCLCLCLCLCLSCTFAYARACAALQAVFVTYRHTLDIY